MKILTAGVEAALADSIVAIKAIRYAFVSLQINKGRCP